VHAAAVGRARSAPQTPPPLTPWPTRPRPRSYKLPEASAALSPLIYTLPGALVNRQRLTQGPGPGSVVRRAGPLAAVVGALLECLVGLLTPTIAKLADSTGPVFTDDPATGRPVARPAFAGFVSVAEGEGGGGADVAVAWRGTIFLEEWQRNFQDDAMARPRAPQPCGRARVCWSERAPSLTARTSAQAAAWAHSLDRPPPTTTRPGAPRTQVKWPGQEGAYNDSEDMPAALPWGARPRPAGGCEPINVSPAARRRALGPRAVPRRGPPPS
jgi:hypothetical protein